MQTNQDFFNAFYAIYKKQALESYNRYLRYHVLKLKSVKHLTPIAMQFASLQKMQLVRVDSTEISGLNARQRFPLLITFVFLDPAKGNPNHKILLEQIQTATSNLPQINCFKSAVRHSAFFPNQTIIQIWVQSSNA